MSYAKSLNELKSLSDEDLIRLHDDAANNTIVGINYFLEELRSREAAKINSQVAKLTFWIFWLTLIVTIATLINLYIFINS